MDTDQDSRIQPFHARYYELKELVRTQPIVVPPRHRTGMSRIGMVI